MNRINKNLGIQLVALLLLADLGCSGTPGGGNLQTTDAGSGCSTDADCKGNRVCLRGACVDPSNDGGPLPADGGAVDTGTIDTGVVDSAPSQSCSISFSSSTCEACFAASCQSSCDGCSGDPACLAAVSCLSNCGTDQTCQNACINALSSASASRLNAVFTCAASCSSCLPPGGVGDSCTSNASCTSGNCTGAGWCTEVCSASNSVCAGGHGSGGLYNQYSQLNWCIMNQAGYDTCFPGCSTNADCAHFPGTTCKTFVDVNGGSDSVCST
jgi:hypothetical protein